MHNTWGEDVAHLLDERFKRVDERFDAMDARLDDHSRDIDEKLGQMNDRIDRVHEAMRVQTRWTAGTIALFGTIVTVLLAIAPLAAG